MEEQKIKMIQTIAQTIYDKKGSNIIAIDVRGVSSMTNYYIIAEGAVDRHLQALNREVLDKLKELGYDAVRVEGGKSGDWIAIDGGDIVVHLMTPLMREAYKLEEVWTEGKLIELNIKTDDE